LILFKLAVFLLKAKMNAEIQGGNIKRAPSTSLLPWWHVFRSTNLNRWKLSVILYHRAIRPNISPQ